MSWKEESGRLHVTISKCFSLVNSPDARGEFLAVDLGKLVQDIIYGGIWSDFTASFDGTGTVFFLQIQCMRSRASVNLSLCVIEQSARGSLTVQVE